MARDKGTIKQKNITQWINRIQHSLRLSYNEKIKIIETRIPLNKSTTFSGS